MFNKNYFNFIQDKKAFTLIELLISVTIISILGAMILISVGGLRNKARITKAQEFNRTIQSSIGYTAVGVWKFDDEGISATDESGYGNNCVISNAEYIDDTANDYGRSLKFSGTESSYINCGDDALAGKEQTWVVWVKRNEATEGSVINQTSSGTGYEPIYFNTEGDIKFYSSKTGNSDYFDTNIPANRWTHIAMVLNNEFVKCYIDGKFFAEKEDDCWDFGKKELVIGKEFDGVIDEVFIYEKAFETREIQKHFADLRRK
ncbi:MAG: LamG-like jellyroll fold domain-containing protein [Patescibacteria group bacterium]|nr:LamG-like jellyroll fold domain-containing protein [Patescibacteria group bacterium]